MRKFKAKDVRLQDSKLSDERKLELAVRLEAYLEDLLISTASENDDEESDDDNDLMADTNEDKLLKEMERLFVSDRSKLQTATDTDYTASFVGLHRLKYESRGYTKVELALAYLEDGDFFMKHNKFHTAYFCFTQGLAADCGNAYLKAQLQKNRSTCISCTLKNYSVVLGALETIKNTKNLKIAAWYAFKLKDYPLCIDYCNQLKNMEHNAVAVKLLGKAKFEMFKQSRYCKEDENCKEIYDILDKRGIEFKNSNSPLDEILKSYENNIDLGLSGNCLIWPLAILDSDGDLFIHEVDEESSFEEFLKDCGYEYFSLSFVNFETNTGRKIDARKVIQNFVNEEKILRTGKFLIFCIFDDPINERSFFLDPNGYVTTTFKQVFPE